MFASIFGYAKFSYGSEIQSDSWIITKQHNSFGRQDMSDSMAWRLLYFIRGLEHAYP